MRKAIIIIFFVFLFYLIEFVLFNLLGGWFKPNLLLILVMFFGLLLGIRYSIFTAVIAGLLKDSFSTNFVGIHLLSFVICAYMTTILKVYVYQIGSRFSRFLLVSIIVTINFVCQSLFYFMFSPVHFTEALQYVLMPDLITTLIVATITFEKLKICVSRLFVLL